MWLLPPDETKRIEKERRENKVLPLVEMGITEAPSLTILLRPGYLLGAKRRSSI